VLLYREADRTLSLSPITILVEQCTH